jgi:Na+-transporting NADH:ubiquinone oxidoreductase subunit NqrB
MGRCGQVKTLSMLPILCARYPAYLHDFNDFNPVVFLVFLAILPPIFGFKSHNQVAQSDDMDQNVGYQSTRQRIAIIAVLNHPEP